MTAYLGRVVRAVLPTVSASNAGGFWNPVMAQYYQQAGTWPEGSGADPYFDNTTLLLHGDGTNGAQNNTFLDGSTNNFTITRNGNATQGSFNPYVGPGNWSAFFNNASGVQWNNGGRITVSSTATFTIEAWIYLTASPVSTAPILADGQNNTATVYWAFDVNITRNLQFFWYTGSSVTCASTGTVSLNQWTHVAVSVSAGAIKLFINGTLQSTTGTTTLTNPSGSTAYMQSGMRGSPANYFTGYISNLRLTKSAVYSATFTPSTTPLIATTDTTLLAFQNNNFSDLSASNAGATSVFGAPLASKFSPFTFYQTTPASYSGYFDGTGDYLSLPTSAGLQLGSSDFTFETWVYFSDVSTDRALLYWNANASGYSALHVRASAAKWVLWMSQNGSSWAIQQSALGSTIVVGQWYHVAAVRSGTNVKLYINGSDVTAGGYTLTGSLMTTYTLNQIGVYNSASYYMQGSLSNFRITNTAVYTGNFTPSTSPLTAISGTSLLTCQSTTFIDNSTNALAITVNGNATPERANPFTDTVTGPTPYSTTTYGGSAYFDGAGDYLAVSTTANAAFNFGTGDFTVEAWVYYTGTNASATKPIIDFRGAVATAPSIFGYTSNQLALFYNGSIVYQPPSLTLISNAWNHVALVRSSGVTRFYLNGAGAATTYTDTNNYPNAACIVGTDAVAGGSSYWQGYILNLRVVKGTAVYTGPFVPSAAPVTAVTNTQLLLNGTNAGIFDNTAFADLETVGNTQISTSVVKYGTGSIYFDGAGDWLIVNSPNGANDYAFGSGDFTLEMWIYPTDITSVMLYDSRPNSSVGVYPTLYINSSSSITYYTNGSDRISGASAVINTWQHIALVRASGTTKLYINGTQSGSTYTDANTYLNGASRPIIGVDGGNTSLQNYAGYIDDLRITKGVARYTANFTPPAAAFPNF